jgi:RpiR family carbohydrate utilization transcriptional regulator
MTSNLRIEMSRALQISAKKDNLSLIEVISKELPKLNKTQTKVARAILADPNSATESSIASLAKKSVVSEPSANRFCKRFNAKGFPDLKLRIAKSLASGICYVYPKIEASDNVAIFTPKIFDAAISNLALIRENICHHLIDQIIENLVQAKRIYFFALGAASIVARDAVNKFHSLSLPVSSHDDILIQQMFASKGHQKDVFFIISDTNHNKELLDVAKTAKKNGSVVISLTPSKSALSNVSTFSLNADIFEFSDNQMPLSSSVVYLVILDVLIMGVALNIGNSHNITEA